MSTRKGINVYHGTGKVDWMLVKEAGYDFAMIKSSEGNTLADRSISENLTKAAMAGLHTGVYHWTHAVSTEPRLDAKGRGWLIDVTALNPPVRHAHIQVRSKEKTANCNFNVM